MALPLAASADAIPRGAAAKDIKAVGYSDLQGRPGFKMSIRQSGERWYLYMTLTGTVGGPPNFKGSPDPERWCATAKTATTAAA